MTMNATSISGARRGFLRASALNVAAPLAGVVLGACGGGSSPAVAQGNDAALSFPAVPAGKRSLAISADGTKISLNEYGNPAGKPILFVHGFSQSRLSWSRQFMDTGLAGRYRICTVDLRGHGDSDKPVGPYTPRDQAADIHAAITALGIARPTIVGWSFGGVVTLDYLAVHGSTNVSKIVFVGSGYGASSTPGAPLLMGPGLTNNVPLMLSDDASENARGTLGLIQACSFSPLGNSDVAFALAYNMLATPASRGASLTGRPAIPEDYDKTVMASLRRDGIPVLAITGANDNIVLPSAARDIAVATGGSLLSYPNVGHMPFIEATARFNADLAAFVG